MMSIRFILGTVAYLVALLSLASSSGWSQQPNIGSRSPAETNRTPVDDLESEKDSNANEKSLLKEAFELKRRISQLHPQGRFDEAIAEGKRLLDIFRQLRGERHPDYGFCLGDLGTLYFDRGDFAQGVRLHRQALSIIEMNFGERHLHCARSLEILGLAYLKMAELEDAETFLNKAFEIRKAELGAEHPEYVRSLENLGQVHAIKGDFQRAESLFQKALDVRRKTAGTKSPQYAQSLSQLAAVYGISGEYIRAEPLLLEVLSLMKEFSGEQPFLYAQSLNQVARFYLEMGEYKKAKPLFLEGIEILGNTVGQSHPLYLRALTHLGNLCRSMGDFDDAESYHLQTSEGYRQLHGARSAAYARALGNLGVVYSETGDWKKADDLFQVAEKIIEARQGQDHPDYLAIMQNRAALFQDLGDYARAQSLYRETLKIAQTVWGVDHPSYATIGSNLGVLSMELGNFDKAEQLFRQSITTLDSAVGQRHPDYARSLGNLGELYSRRGDYDRAESLLREALKINLNALGENHPTCATNLSNLGGLYWLSGDIAKAEEFVARAIHIDEKVHGPSHPDFAVSLNNLAVLKTIRGELIPAERLFERSLQSIEKQSGKEHPAYARALSNLATLRSATGNDAAAKATYRQAFDISWSHIKKSAAGLTERQQLESQQSLAHRLDSYLSCLLRLEEDQHAIEAFDPLAGWKGATLTRQRAMRLATVDSSLSPLFTELQNVTRQWARLLDTATQNKITRQQLSRITARKEELEAELSSKSSLFRETRESVKAQDLVDSLPDDAVLIDFLEFTYHSVPAEATGGNEFGRVRHLLATVWKHDRRPELFDLGPIAPIRDAIGRWRANGSSEKGVDSGRFLRSRLWDPLQPTISSARTVLISPDVELARLAFGALPGNQDGTYLMEDHRIAYVAAPRLIPGFIRKPVANSPSALLLVGNIDYGFNPQGTNRWKSLPSTAKEIRRIRTLREQAGPSSVPVLLQGKMANEARIREEQTKCNIHHYATHGLFEIRESPVYDTATSTSGRHVFGLFDDHTRTFTVSRSGLVLAGANEQQNIDSDEIKNYDDGLLVAEEIVIQTLGHVNLVVLSACDTAQGEQQRGEGLLGIQRAFQVAGARTTIAALWPVDDAATSVLMEQFYGNLWLRRMSALDALREAQLWMMRNPDKVGPDMRGAERELDEAGKATSIRFWAAFTLSGDWR